MNSKQYYFRPLDKQNTNLRISQQQRKCYTPSLNNGNKKFKNSRIKQQKSTQHHKQIKSFNNIKINQLNNQVSIHKKQSPYRHKNRSINNLYNTRHAKNIQHQLSNLNQSIFNQASILHNQSDKKNCQGIIKINQGKKMMKNNQFQKGMTFFNNFIIHNENNIEALYLLGVCSFHLEIYQSVIKNLSMVLIQNQLYRKNVYLFLSIAYKKLEMIDEALLMLTRALNIYPKYYDALILRAKILSKQKRHYDAINDLNRCIKLEPKNIQAYISKADCLRFLSQYKQAIKIYSEILQIKYNNDILMKKAITYIENGNINQALKDLNIIINKNIENSQAYLFKGTAYVKIKNYNEAILSYQQAIKYNNSKKVTTKALYEILKLKIDLGDYYGASYTLQRANTFEIDMKILEKLKIFIEGVIFIIRKQYRKGIDNLTYLCKKQHFNQQIKPLLYSFRSYAYFCQYKFINAINDLNNMNKFNYQLDSSSQYNYYLLSGIINCQSNNFNLAMNQFTQASNRRKQFSQPLIYKCLTKICQYNRTSKQKNTNLLTQALNYIQKSLENQQNSNSYYICACLFYILGDMQPALENIDKAIQKSDDHVTKHFYLKALIKAMMQKYMQSFNNLNNVLSLIKDKKQKDTLDSNEINRHKQIPEVYLNRAKCYLIFGQKRKAFQDLQTFIELKPLDSEIHTITAKLLFSIGACQDAIKAYKYSPKIKTNKEYLLERAQCYLLLKQLNLCLNDMQKMIQMGDQLIKIDYYCLSALKQGSRSEQINFIQALKLISNTDELENKNGYIFKQSDKLFYKGVFKFHLQKYQQSKQLFQQSKNIKINNNELQFLQNKIGLNLQDNYQNTIYTDIQIDYNIALCLIMLNNFIEAKSILKQYPTLNTLFITQNINTNELIDITPFSIKNRLCSIFPSVKYTNNFKLKLSFCLPNVQPPEMKFQKQQKIIEQLDMTSTQAKPDGPWIKRNNFGVIFTDELMGFDIDIKTQKSMKKEEQILIQQGQDTLTRKNKLCLRESFSLDVEVESKLNRLMQRNKKDKNNQQNQHKE